MYRIIVVEDELWIRKGLVCLLESINDDFCVAADFGSAAEAVAWCQSEMPDLLITDICMEETDGLDLIAQLKEIYPALNTIIITGYERIDFLKQAIMLNANDYLLKPVVEEQLQLALKRRKKELDRRVLPDTVVSSTVAELRELIHRKDMEAVRTVIHERREHIRTTGLPVYRQIAFVRELIAALNIENFPQEASVGVLWDILMERLKELCSIQTLGGQSVQLAVQTMRLVKERYAESLTLSQVAEELHVSSAYLGQLFNKVYGYPFGEAVHTERIGRAKELLGATQIPIADISSTIGYKTLDHFYRRFKQAVGISPAAYREQKQTKS